MVEDRAAGRGQVKKGGPKPGVVRVGGEVEGRRVECIVIESDLLGGRVWGAESRDRTR